MWKLEVHGVTCSFINFFQKCRYRTYLKYIKGLEPAVRPNLDFVYGSLVHKALETMYKTRAELSFPQVLGLHNDVCRNEYKIKPTDVPLGTGELHSMMHAYHRVYAQELGLAKAVECEWLVPYVYPDGLTVPLRGKIDLILGENHEVIDHKTTSKIPAMLDFQHKLQTYMYSYAVMCLHDLQKVRFTYNFIQKTRMENYKHNPLDYFTRRSYHLTKKQILRFVTKFLNPIMQDIRNWDKNPKNSPFTMELYDINGEDRYFEYVVRGVKSALCKRSKVFSELSMKDTTNAIN